MASKAGFMRFLKKKMADGGMAGGEDVPERAAQAGRSAFPSPKPKPQASPSASPSPSRDPDYEAYQKKQLATMADGGEVKTADKWGEIGGDPGYGQPYNRHNSHGEPHTNQYMEDEHPMSYMADGGMAYHDQPGEPYPDPDHHEQDPDAGPNPSYSNQMGEPDPDMDHMEQPDPDMMPHPMAHDQIHPGMYAKGGMAYEHQHRMGEEEDDQEFPDMSDKDAMSKHAPGFSGGGRVRPSVGKFGNMSKGGMAKHAFAHALMKKR